MQFPQYRSSASRCSVPEFAVPVPVMQVTTEPVPAMPVPVAAQRYAITVTAEPVLTVPVRAVPPPAVPVPALQVLAMTANAVPVPLNSASSASLGTAITHTGGTQISSFSVTGTEGNLRGTPGANTCTEALDALALQELDL